MSHFLVAADPETWSLPSESVAQVNLRPGDPERRQPETRRSGTLSDEGPQLRTDLEEELLRGVTLSEGLSGMGSHWASNSTDEADFELSFKTSKYDHFLSQDWLTSRWLKLCTMLFIFNSRAAMVATLICSLVLGLCRPTDSAPKYGDGVEIHISSFCVYLAFLLFFFFWQRIRTLLRRPLVVFLDKLCIAQGNPELKEKGILGLAGFLEKSDHLTILWSARYFTRLWCCYEVATFLRHRQQTKGLTLRPVALSVMLVVNSFCQFLGVVQNNVLAWALQTGALEAGNAVPPYVISLVGFGMLFLAAIPVGCYSALGTLRDIRDLEPQLKQFDVERSECFCCSNDHRHPDTGQKLRCDRRLVFHTLKGWYGEAGDTADEHLKRFNSIVQTSLRHKVLEGADSVIFPLRIAACMTVAACAPWFCDSLTWAKAFCIFQEELGPFSAAWRCLAVVTREWSRFLAVFLFPYAMVKVCKLGLPLVAMTSQLKASLLVACASFAAIGAIWLASRMPYTLLQRAGYVDLWPWLTLAWLLLALSLMRGFRCKSK